VTTLISAAGVLLAILLLLARALVVDEVRGRMRRRIVHHLEVTIASLSKELRDGWAEEWRADLAEVIDMPLEAMKFVRNVRQSAHQLADEPCAALNGPALHDVGDRAATVAALCDRIAADNLPVRRWAVSLMTPEGLGVYDSVANAELEEADEQEDLREFLQHVPSQWSVHGALISVEKNGVIDIYAAGDAVDLSDRISGGR
jgi:hypothetical protein